MLFDMILVGKQSKFCLDVEMRENDVSFVDLCSPLLIAKARSSRLHLARLEYHTESQKFYFFDKN